ncbi:hypothetical protein QBC42DRAFT_332222 [Cladorrhinum samala]|uniref:Uncharacterized protein n=1 Tax=Cladorrhinum samala TaxID=585594 RepID=A0AAV9HK99_9PEZI|nr:hypothetical protein QBC42DRAFT_332222 [Cladorrhinum samala]
MFSIPKFNDPAPPSHAPHHPLGPPNTINNDPSDLAAAGTRTFTGSLDYLLDPVPPPHQAPLQGSSRWHRKPSQASSSAATASTIATTLGNFRFPEDGSSSVAVPSNHQNNNNNNNRHIELPPLAQTQSSTSTTTRRPSKTPSPSSRFRSRSRFGASSKRRSNKKSAQGGDDKKKRQRVKALPKKGYLRLRWIGSRLRKRLSRGKKRLGKKPAGGLLKLRVQLENPVEVSGHAGEVVGEAVPVGIVPVKKSEEEGKEEEKKEAPATKTGCFLGADSTKPNGAHDDAPD